MNIILKNKIVFRNMFLFFLLIIPFNNIYSKESNEVLLPTGQTVKVTDVYYYPNNDVYFISCMYGEAANIILPDGQTVKAKYVTFYEDGAILAFTLIDGQELKIRFPNGDFVKTTEVRYKRDKTPLIVKEDDNIYSVFLPDGRIVKAQSVFYDENGTLKMVTLADEESIILKIKGKEIKARQKIEFNDNGTVKFAK